ncbi:ASCH domain-containing protein [Brevibacillus agri]|uniref:ASCH domain-containing protein n=1 Tax=Brevibacillus agri TaxID=51101 RepID=UPI003D1FCF2A
MKAITIYQPWATLIALGEKRYETRGWKTNYRGPIAIHASKNIDHQAALMVARNCPEIWRKISPLPTGCVVAVAELVECWSVHLYQNVEIYLHEGVGGGTRSIDPQEEKFGWYEPGRYAWELANMRKIDPVPAKGQQGLWNWGGER